MFNPLKFSHIYICMYMLNSRFLFIFYDIKFHPTFAFASISLYGLATKFH